MGLLDFKLSDVGSVFTSLREAITGEKITDPRKLLEDISKLETTFLNVSGKIIEAEAKSEHFLTASWRPITMLTFVFIIANNYIIVPYATALLGVEIPALELTADMWSLLKLGLGGYVVGRSAEKITPKIAEYMKLRKAA